MLLGQVRAVKSDVIILSPPAISSLRLVIIIIIMHYRCHTNPLYYIHTQVGRWKMDKPLTGCYGNQVERVRRAVGGYWSDLFNALKCIYIMVSFIKYNIFIHFSRSVSVSRSFSLKRHHK